MSFIPNFDLQSYLFRSFNIIFKESKFLNIMNLYAEDEFEYLRNSCRTEQYQLNTNIVDNVLEIQLIINKKNQASERYHRKLKFEELQQSLKQKFENLKNIQAFLLDSNNLNVNLQNGSIALVMSISLFNGKSITTKLGDIKLEQDRYDSEKNLQEILKLCEGKKQFTGSTTKNIIKQFVNMFKILFQKQKYKRQKKEYQDIFQLRENKQAGKKDNKRNYDSYGFDSKIKSDKSIDKNERRFSLNQYQWDLQMQNSPSKNSAQILSCGFDKQQLQKWKKDIESDLLKIKQKAKENFTQFQNKILQVKKQLRSQFSVSKKQKQVKEFQSPPKNSNSNVAFMMGLKVPHLQDKNVKDLQQQIESLGQKIKQVSHESQQFSKVVQKKIQILGHTNQIFEDKFKRLLEELDLRVQRRIIDDSIDEVKNKIIDTSALFFQQFQLRGLEIEYKGQDSQSTILLGKVNISQKNWYSIKIMKTLVSNIQIGIVDSKYKNKRDCWSEPNFILYVGWNSTIYEGPNQMVHKQGQGIREGDVVTVRTNTETGLIEWLVAGQVRAKHTWQKLKDKTINWVPMIRFYDHGDVISWMTEQMYKP